MDSFFSHCKERLSNNITAFNQLYDDKIAQSVNFGNKDTSNDRQHKLRIWLNKSQVKSSPYLLDSKFAPDATQMDECTIPTRNSLSASSPVTEINSMEISPASSSPIPEIFQSSDISSSPSNARLEQQHCKTMSVRGKGTVLSNEERRTANDLGTSKGSTGINDENIQDSCGSVLWERMEEETLIAKLLKEYCPVRFRKNKRYNYDSEEFRLKQHHMTVRTLLEQEYRPYKKITFCPSKRSSRWYFPKWFHFEEEKDVLDSIDLFVACNATLRPVFRGSRIAQRRHFFRRWRNRETDRHIICEELMERWLEDRKILTDLKMEREMRQMKRDSEKFKNESTMPSECNEFPPISVVLAKLIESVHRKINNREASHPPKRGSQVIILQKGPPLGIPYFGAKKEEAKRWVRKLLLKI